jgi:hypothetical protein
MSPALPKSTELNYKKKGWVNHVLPNDVKEVSEKLLKIRSETSDYTDYLRLHRLSRRRFNLCNLLFPINRDPDLSG